VYSPVPKHKTTRLKGKELEALRFAVWERDGHRCVTCGRPVPLNGNVFERAHLAHIRSRGAGGEDTPENTRIKCFHCHIIQEHGKGE